MNADRERLLQALAALLNNAISASGPGGTVGITAQPLADAVMFSVCDEGAPVPEREQKRLFEPDLNLESTPYEGSAWRLSIVKGLIEAHRGRLWFESDENRGNRFHFAVPCAQAQFSQHPGHGTAGA